MDARSRLDVGTLIVDRQEANDFRVARRVFTDPEIFELEMKNIFEGTWVFLAHESQLPKPHDFYTTRVGRQPVVVSRDGDGVVHCFFDACSHRGAKLMATKRGNKAVHMCYYHGWTYNSAGRCLGVREQDKGAYPACFTELDHDLTPIARVDSYRGFIFGSLNPDVPELVDHLAEAKAMIDLFADSSDQGLEVIRGCHTYTSRANWKIQLENIDGYHFFPTHSCYVGQIQRRMAGDSANKLKAVDLRELANLPSGSYDLGNGHVMDWGEMPNFEDRPLDFRRPEIVDRYGERRARWMINRVRNLVLFPNLLLMDNASTTLRIIHPLAPDLTKCETYCIAPVGEPAEGRRLRLRQYEDFLGPAGQATPDDQSVMERCQQGFQATHVAWQQGYARGSQNTVPGGDDDAKLLGIDPLFTSLGDTETFCHGFYRQWRELMT
ncbi:MAG: aromatic ring-hydroxylating oxygenase subunit alpha [Immundisolibacter sp.]|uniref:aromatic ring-hydroxylating oxygenase subunit alpha n=1 Tax=Immundisolibacter sp. TaxID=1934948 RepID=UPI003EE33FFA